ncbi:MAG: deoxyribose-phosphate aldolase [Deltaproteobacteria bacterium]|nr:deoxyribose-phosphate aldolase [Deltaproteobacteria bacterium]
MMNNPAALIDHTLLKPDMTEAQVLSLCEEAVEHGFASVCLPPAFVAVAVDRLYGSAVRVGSVVGFPCGYNSLRQKITETAELVALGAEEIDMVISIGNLLARRFDLVEAEIAQVVLAAEQAPVKVIIECCYLDQELKQRATELVVNAGAAYVKTSTGFAPGGATVADVALLVAVAAGRIGVKAAGGIRDLDSCQQMIVAGATRIGSSAGVKIVTQWYERQDVVG